MIIFLDLDGVIINFAEGVCNWFEIPYEPRKVTHWDALYPLTKIKKEAFWASLNVSAFWENLNFYPDAKSFIKKLTQYGKVILLSSPAPGCAGYRQNWIENNLPEFFNSGHYILSPAKWAYANKNTILIDDSDENCQQFEQNNGFAILYPQPWNNGRRFSTSEKEKNNTIIKLLSSIKS